jgi:hypothetical protein
MGMTTRPGTRIAVRILIAAGGIALIAGVAGVAVAAPTTTPVSVTSAHKVGNDDSLTSAVSGDGRYVAFESRATNLVPGDTNGEADIFVQDRVTRKVERVSVSGAGKQANRSSHLTNAAISHDGRYVVFESVASNLVSGDTNNVSDIFVRDRVAKTTIRATVNTAGKQGNADSFNATINDDARYVVFSSAATNLVPGDTNGFMDVFRWDRLTRRTIRVSVSTGGAQGNDDSIFGVASAKGRYVYFESHAGNLVPGDVHSDLDVFLFDPVARTTQRVSVDSNGHELPGGANGGLSISASGDVATFVSGAEPLNGLRPQVYVHYRAVKTTMLVSVNNAHQPANTGADSPSISPTGGFVAFSSLATNLAPGLSKGPQIYVRNLGAATTERVSVNNGGVAANGQSTLPAASLTGVSFTSTAGNLGVAGRFSKQQIFFRSR